ncbi:MAG TPA: HdeD family acid-resistance protein [Vicinamibacterales bacterium]|nr:HdeD family acid-resistance protein [Vicinamibacterales bacterium]
MSSETLTANPFAGGMSEGNVRGWVIFGGITMMLLGTAAVIYDTTATTVSVVLFGWLLMVAGVMQVVNAFQVRGWSGFFLYLLDGIIRTTVGTLIVLYPDSGAQSITLLLSFYFIVGGLFKTIASIALQFPSWGWSVASGLVAVALGVMLAMQWPNSATWFIGFAVGIDLILYGWTLLMFAAALKELSNSFA